MKSSKEILSDCKLYMSEEDYLIVESAFKTYDQSNAQQVKATRMINVEWKIVGRDIKAVFPTHDLIVAQPMYSGCISHEEAAEVGNHIVELHNKFIKDK